MKRASSSPRKILRHVRAIRFDRQVEPIRLDENNDRLEDQLDSEWLRDKEDVDYGHLEGEMGGALKN